MPPKSAKGKEKEIDPDLTETDPDLTETDPDLTQSDPDLIDADDYAADDEQQAGPSSVFYCGKCGEHLDGRIGPLCWNCEGSETQESWQARDHRLRDNEAYKRAKEAGICCYCRKRQADPGHSSCTPCRLRKKGHDHARRRKAKEKESEEKKKAKEEKKTKEKEKSKEKNKNKK
ncbi:hypothetical protein NW767_004551 [Fusarium falciforme]|uniref:Uncharacterized protein n=1 Tax=Fusarium falciforme TaxID=195108 RepID=A0A9W8QYD1_9HYPO|nr:hypothetical protein NW755_011263 [Fusarium falciforme]KAJ4204358.1 hypothetical protein NW767_004551 [Fusarium falciforme]